LAERELKYVKVHTLSNRFEADVITEALRQEGIPVLLRSFEETAYTALFTPQKGWGRIMVPKEMADLAREIISSLTQENESDSPPSAGDWQIAPRFWEALRQADPKEVVSRAVVEFQPEDNLYIVPFLNTVVMCYPETEEIELPGSLAGYSEDFQLNGVIVHYLLAARNKPLANKWVSEKDLPGGSLFFTASHTLPLESLSNAFDQRPQLLDAAARNMGGEKVNLGGLAYRFMVLPRIPILIIFWIRDEEFEPSFHILFDDTISEHLNSLDLVWGIANVFARVLLGCAAAGSEGV
jgi:hypothetical protein